MAELLTILFVALIFLLFFKVFVLMAKAGIFLILLPFKILFSLIGAVLFIIVIAAFAVPVLVAASVFVVPLLLVIGGLMLILK